MQRQGEPTAEAIANAATARPGRTEKARDDSAAVAAAAEERPSAAGGGATDKDEKVNRRVAR
eukprot:COSAG04_NODE_12012_length_676_cov_0.837088_1_plen_61_part_10